ncbi:MAG: oxidoreductase C-terminal domain-containing protein, partial [Brevundimonas sp.]
QAVEAVNAAPEFMIGRQWLTSRREVDPVRLGDLGVPVKDV